MFIFDSVMLLLVKNVVIVGGGIVGWMVVIVFVKLLGKLFNIIFVEFKDIGIIGVGEVIIFFIRIFYKLFNIDEKVFMKVM